MERIKNLVMFAAALGLGLSWSFIPPAFAADGMSMSRDRQIESQVSAQVKQDRQMKKSREGRNLSNKEIKDRFGKDWKSMLAYQDERSSASF